MATFLSDLILRPPRGTYDPDDLKDPLTFKSMENTVTLDRESISFTNNRGQNLVGSYYPAPFPASGNPCIIYLHGNASSQLEGIPISLLVKDIGISTLCIDLSGSGNSDGEYISLGFYEKDDVNAAIAFLNTQKSVKKVILWGRSMGATIALWCCSGKNPCVLGCVADSPYLSIRRIVDDFCGNSWIFWILKKLIFPFVDRKVQSRAGFKVDDVDISGAVANAQVPCFIIHGISDSFISVSQSREIFRIYGCCEKYMVCGIGSHNSDREIVVYVMAIRFVLKLFGIEVDFEVPETIETLEECEGDSFHFENPLQMAANMDV
jgi:pimeloyl-ACP methyl ester carboxylesterase